MRPGPRALVPALAATAAFALPQANGQGGPVVTVEPAQVEMTMLYTGSRVHVRARVPAGEQVAIVLSGGARDLDLKRKGKVFGLIWMNVADVRFEAVPDLYLLRTTRPLAQLADPEVLRRLGLGLDALGSRSARTVADPSLFRELARLKWRDGLWNVTEATVTLGTPAADGETLAEADFLLPAKTPPGEYRVRVYTFAREEGELAGEAGVRVEQAGVAAVISELAQRHGLLYGILAVVVAGAAGLLTGVVFGLGSKKGH
jgi:uncharacterized protein (TIGR02186 family)